MNWRPILDVLPHQRIHRAALAAVLCHALVFGVSVYVIHWLAVPSTIDRVLNLTLIPSPLDGNTSQDSAVDETLNNVEQGITKSDSIEQLQPDPSVTDQSDSKIVEAPPPIIEPTDKPMEKMESISSTSDQLPAEPEITEQLSEIQPDENASDKQQNSVLTRQPSRTPALLTVEQEQPSVPATEDQQLMLFSKINEIANNLEDFDELPSELKWESDGQHYSASFFQVPVKNEMGLAEIRVRVKTEFEGAELSTEMNLKQLAFSNFAQFVHRWDSDLQIHDDQLDGRFHSNSRINLEFGRRSGPVFHGKVTTASYRVNMNRYTRRSLKKNVFLGGLETGVRRIPMPKPSMLYFDDEANQDENSIYFETDTRIIFYANGSYSAESLTNPGEASYHDIGDKALYIRCAEDVTLFLQGTVNGKILVYSPRRITIESNLVYANRSPSPENDDFLGLVSGRNIVIAGPSVTGRGDLQIDASIYAKGRFIVSGYKSRRSGTLKVFGSVSAGSMSATEPRYATNIVFDPRLEHRRPPNFPTTDRYEVQDKEIRWSRLNKQ